MSRAPPERGQLGEGAERLPLPPERAIRTSSKRMSGEGAGKLSLPQEVGVAEGATGGIHAAQASTHGRGGWGGGRREPLPLPGPVKDGRAGNAGKGLGGRRGRGASSQPIHALRRCRRRRTVDDGAAQVAVGLRGGVAPEATRGQVLEAGVGACFDHRLHASMVGNIPSLFTHWNQAPTSSPRGRRRP